jgi:hypothetical protein
MRDAQEQPLSLFAILDRLDKSCDGCDDDAGERRRRHVAGADHPGREACEERGGRDHDGKSREIPALGYGDSAADHEGSERRPESGLAIGLKEQDDANPKENRNPGEKPALLDLQGDALR